MQSVLAKYAVNIFKIDLKFAAKERALIPLVMYLTQEIIKIRYNPKS